MPSQMSRPKKDAVLLRALEEARHRLVAMHGLLAADGAAPRKRWTLDTAAVVAELDKAIALCEKEKE